MSIKNEKALLKAQSQQNSLVDELAALKAEITALKAENVKLKAAAKAAKAAKTTKTTSSFFSKEKSTNE